jgi:hypothetical protein
MTSSTHRVRVVGSCRAGHPIDTLALPGRLTWKGDCLRDDCNRPAFARRPTGGSASLDGPPPAAPPPRTIPKVTAYATGTAGNTRPGCTPPGRPPGRPAPRADGPVASPPQLPPPPTKTGPGTPGSTEPAATSVRAAHTVIDGIY